MKTLQRLKSTQEILKTIIKYVNIVGEDYVGQVEIKTFEETLYVTCNEDMSYEFETIFNSKNFDFIVRDNGNGNVKFMIKIGD